MFVSNFFICAWLHAPKYNLLTYFHDALWWTVCYVVKIAEIFVVKTHLCSLLPTVNWCFMNLLFSNSFLARWYLCYFFFLPIRCACFPRWLGWCQAPSHSWWLPSFLFGVIRVKWCIIAMSRYFCSYCNFHQQKFQCY